MSNKPYLSIVIPTFNRAEKLRFALYCLLHQTFVDFEIIVSDNWSTDHTKEVVASFHDKRVRYVKNPTPTIYSYNLKNAIRHARGEYIFFHSDDDLIPDRNSLEVISRKMKASRVGYVRVNYLCVSPDRKRLFYFNLSQEKVYQKDYRLKAHASGNDMISFLVHSDHYFITGLIIKNSLPKNIHIIPSEHAPWIAMVCHALQEYGGLFIAKPYVVASWSTWRNKKDGAHPVYSLSRGKLECEYYFDVVHAYLDKQEFDVYVHEQFMQNYVRIFPLIKTLIGNSQLLILSRRLRALDPSMKFALTHWIYLFLSLCIPAFALRTMKNTLRSVFMKRSALATSDALIQTYRRMEDAYLDMEHKRRDDQSRFF